MERKNQENHGRKKVRMPAIEIFETPKSVTLRAEMPGVAKEDFDISVDGDELTIMGRRTLHASGMRLIHGEGNPSDYYRTFSLGDSLDTCKVEADVENGILTLTFHKKPEILPKKIQVEVK